MPNVSTSSKTISAFVHLVQMVNNVKQLHSVVLEIPVCMEENVKTLDQDLTVPVLRNSLELDVNTSMMPVKLELARMVQLVQILEVASNVSAHLGTLENSAMKILSTAKKIHAHHLLLALISLENSTANVHLI